MIGYEEIEKRFGTHEATTEGENPTLPKHENARAAFMQFVLYLDERIPDGRAKNVMMTHLEDASMWANKAISYEAPLITN